MKIAHNITVSAFCKGEDKEEDIENAIKQLCPFDLEKEKLHVKKTIAKGYQESRIVIMELSLVKKKQVSLFLDFFKNKLSEEKRDLLLRQADSRLDSEMNFFIRLDKRKFLESGSFWITDSGNCFHIKITIAAYPANREKGLAVIKSWLIA